MHSKSSDAVASIGIALLCLAYVVITLLITPAPAHESPAVRPASSGSLDDDWVELFNGRDFTGWTTTSGGEIHWAIRNGEMYPLPEAGGSWLRTEKMYRDFELELEFFLVEGGNSGVGLRCSHAGDPAFTGMELQIYDTWGQDIHPGCAGAVYNAITPRSMALNQPPSWNAYRIRLIGDTLDVWLNGVPIHEAEKLDERGYFRQPEDKRPLRDRLPTGYIALQEHGAPIRFRNIRLRDLSPDPDPGGYEFLFNHRDLDGWEVTGAAAWTVEGGTLVGRDGPGHLFTTAEFDDFELRAFVRVNERGNGGIYCRARPNPDDADSWPVGYEAQVDQHDPRNFTGSIYDRAWASAHPGTRDGAWFDYRIRAEGGHLQTWINGRPQVDAQLDAFGSGRIALQSHHPGNAIEFRDLRIRRLP